MNIEPFKADPNRFFREGDKAKVVKNKGRIGTTKTPVGTIVTVMDDEHECEWLFIKNEESGEIDSLDPAYLELVTPVEEAEPFYVERCDIDGCYFVQKDDGEMTAVDTLVQAFYFKAEDYNAHYYTEGQAEELANETCKRLNDEYRKEQE